MLAHKLCRGVFGFVCVCVNQKESHLQSFAIFVHLQLFTSGIFFSASSANCINRKINLEQSFSGRELKFDGLSRKVKMYLKFAILKLPHKMLKWLKNPRREKHITYSVFQFYQKRLLIVFFSIL